MTDAQIPVQGQKPEPLEPDQIPAEERVEVPEPPASNRIITDILSSNALLSFLAIVLALVIGAILIAFTDPGVQSSLGYFFSRPADTFRAIGEAVGGAYSALFQGSIYNFRRPGFENGIKPLTETLTFATPAHRGRPRCGARVPRRHVQHRWPWPDPDRRGRGRMGELVVRDAVLPPRDSSQLSPPSSAARSGVASSVCSRRGPVRTR